MPKPPPTPQTEAPKLPETRPKLVADPGADKYKLVFATSYAGKFSYLEKEEKESDEARQSYNDNFIEQLNKAGARGYRLTAITGDLGLVRQGEVQYEYAWFETISNFYFAKNGFEEIYTRLSKQGFSVFDHLFLSRSCKDNENTASDSATQTLTEHCTYLDRFLLERVKGEDLPRQFRLAQHVPHWREWYGDAALTTQVNSYLASGFYPMHAFSRFEVLLQPVTGKGDFLPDKSEVQIVTGNIQKRVNELAQQGYRLALTHYEIAVMYRNRDTLKPVSYVWLQVMKKNFEQELVRLKERGAIYRMIYPDRNGDKYTLVFERPATDDGQRREYRVLKIELQGVENVAEKKVEVDLTPSSKETLKTLNSLVKEGFIVRDLSDSEKNYKTHVYKTNVLLERSL